jgi:hypothetical protein
VFPQRRQTSSHTSNDLTSPAPNTATNVATNPAANTAPGTAPGTATNPGAKPAALTARALIAVTCLSLAVIWAAPAASASSPDPDATDSASLRAVVGQRRTDVVEAQGSVGAAATAASDALERYTLAVRALDAARIGENTRQDQLQLAQDRLAAARAELGRWARSVYAGGSSLAPGSPGFGLASVLRAKSADDLGDTAYALRRVGRSRSRTIDTVAVAEREQAAAADAAAAAAKAAETAAVAASKARTEADDALDRQRQVLAVSETALSDAEHAADVATQREEAAAAAARARSGAGTGGNRVTGPVGDCRGGDVEHYPNGQIPVDALCELAAQPGEYLRADAATAFDGMSRAFAARFGTPICVTDSYRTYDEQVRLKAEKPALAATPGTSNHGWGTATDLCGGIQNFGTPEHEWLAANAPLYNWFHPSWARQGGSKPEPWHFEFAG